MPSLFNHNNNAQANGERDAHSSSYGDSASSERDNCDTDLASLSHRSSPSLEDTSFGSVLIPKLEVPPVIEHSPLLGATGFDRYDDKPQQPPDENLAIAQDAIRGQHMPLPDSGPSLNKEPSEISDLGNHGYGSRKLGDCFLDTSDDDLPFEAPLQDKLLAEHHKFHDGRKGFIPRGHIEKVINEEAVAQNLYECLFSIPSRERDTVIQRYVKHIFRQGPDKKSYVNVFATLVLTEKSDCIGHFLSEGIDDSALPFQKLNRKPQGQVPQLELRPRRGEKRIRAFDQWSLVKKIAFEEWQWAVNAPFFHRGTEKEARIFSLQDPAILPFVKLNPVSGNQEIEEHHGGFGKVSKRYIHADHHDLKGHGKKNMAFAVKKLNSRNYDEFKAEFDMLAKLGKTNHPHLVSLLSAYSQLNNNYLIFDWAESDLLKYWQNHPVPDFNLETVLWVAQQCFGLASALQQIHRYGSIEQERRPGNQTFKKLYGRHGDIKPANILWFSDPDHPAGRGTLRICDFGASEFHTTQSRSNRHNGRVALSPYYRPPECELIGGKISRSYDIWTMGCLYLEFLAWLLGGWELVRKMIIARKSPSAPGDHGANLDFDYPYYDLDDDRKSATIKPAVTKFIESAHANPKCSDFVHDFLDIIQKQLFIVETGDSKSSKRISCGRLYRLLGQKFEKCKTKPEYAVKAKPRTLK